jgi:membrane protein implicated in regulation of membrane protease activity
METWIIWLSLIVILVIIELMSQWLTTFCLAVGCVGALIAALLGCSLTVQLITLAVLTLLTLVIAGPRFKARYARQNKIAASQSNMDALRGRVAIVTEAIAPDKIGRVKIDGDRWQASAQQAETFVVGDHVEVVGYDSIVLIVKSTN